MKKLILGVLLCASSAVMAAETSSFRVNGDIVQVGDSVSQLLSRAGKPLNQHSYNINTSKNTVITITDYIYEIGNEIYTVTVKQGKVAKITWDRR